MAVSKVLPTAALALALCSPVPALAEQSPVFGEASVAAMSQEDTRNVTARGAYANYYGYYAENYLYNAWLWAYYGRYIYAANSNSETGAYYNAWYYSYYGNQYAVPWRKRNPTGRPSCSG